MFVVIIIFIGFDGKSQICEYSDLEPKLMMFSQTGRTSISLITCANRN